MKRSAEEVINNLESRIARLEGRTASKIDTRMERQITTQLKGVASKAKVISSQSWESQANEEGMRSTGTVTILKSTTGPGAPPFFMVVTQNNSWDGYLGAYYIYCITHDLPTAKAQANKIDLLNRSNQP